MNKRKYKKERKNIYTDEVTGLGLEMSGNSYWRKKIFDLADDEFIEVTYKEPNNIPKYSQHYILRYKLEFCVKKVNHCRVKDFDGLVIFKFWSKEYLNIDQFSGNNPGIY